MKLNNYFALQSLNQPKVGDLPTRENLYYGRAMDTFITVSIDTVEQLNKLYEDSSNIIIETTAVADPTTALEYAVQQMDLPKLPEYLRYRLYKSGIKHMLVKEFVKEPDQEMLELALKKYSNQDFPCIPEIASGNYHSSQAWRPNGIKATYRPSRLREALFRLGMFNSGTPVDDVDLPDYLQALYIPPLNARKKRVSQMKSAKKAAEKKARRDNVKYNPKELKKLNKKEPKLTADQFKDVFEYIQRQCKRSKARNKFIDSLSYSAYWTPTNSQYRSQQAWHYIKLMKKMQTSKAFKEAIKGIKDKIQETGIDITKSTTFKQTVEYKCLVLILSKQQPST